jgi:8-oxo-dGTP pyrophosphatase MutT (NUDIX family)
MTVDTGGPGGPAGPTVRAAGGVLWRPAEEGIEIALVHRPRYDDWSFPKGKCHRGEDDEACALREVEEETGARGVIGQPLPVLHYLDREGRPKVVRYWTMAIARSQPHQPDHEVDRVVWLSPDDVAGTLTYAQDRTVLAAALAILRGPTDVLRSDS